MTASHRPRLTPDLPFVDVASREQWRDWLITHAETSHGVWVVTTKKAALRPGQIHVSARDLNEECLAAGWIDSRPARIDDEHSALLCTPRKPGSGWSRVNKERIAALEQSGLILPRGRMVIAAAKADGSWNALDAVDALEVADDLADALRRYPSARAHFDAFPPSSRRGILEWVSAARRPATRAERIQNVAELAEQNIRANQWPRA